MEINGRQDNAINMIDIMTIAGGFNSIKGDGRYVEDSDFNKDGAISMTDIIIVAKHFSSTSHIIRSGKRNKGTFYF
jgi:hypothetical protein